MFDTQVNTWLTVLQVPEVDDLCLDRHVQYNEDVSAIFGCPPGSVLAGRGLQFLWKPHQRLLVVQAFDTPAIDAPCFRLIGHEAWRIAQYLHVVMPASSWVGSVFAVGCTSAHGARDDTHLPLDAWNAKVDAMLAECAERASYEGAPHA